MFSIFVWVMTLHGSGLPGATPLWHSHEMLIGFAMTAVAGFSLTAVANWTGRVAIHGAPVALLLISWLAGRCAMLLVGWIPAGLIFILDMLFPILLLCLLGREIIAGGSRRNYPLIAIMVMFSCLNALYHLGVIGWLSGGERLAIYLLIHSLLLLVTVIAGRIIPSFTGNWLRQQGSERLPVDTVLVNIAAIGLTIVTGLAASFLPMHPITGVLAFGAALVHGIRLSRWRALATISNPLVFVLHVAYLWVPLGYTLLGCSVFGWFFTPGTALHALTIGAISSMILAVTTRVSLGHTGRPLQAARLTVLAYLLIMLAGLLRVLGPLSGGDYLLMIDLSAAAWISAFALFCWVYWPILSRPRTD